MTSAGPVEETATGRTVSFSGHLMEALEHRVSRPTSVKTSSSLYHNLPRPLRSCIIYLELSGPFPAFPVLSSRYTPRADTHRLPLHSRLPFRQRHETGKPPTGSRIELFAWLFPAPFLPNASPKKYFPSVFAVSIETTTYRPPPCPHSAILISTEPLGLSLHRSHRSHDLPTRHLPPTSAVPTEACRPASLRRFPPLPPHIMTTGYCLPPRSLRFSQSL